MVNDKSEIKDAVQKIVDFAKTNGLNVSPAHGKVVGYLKENKPKHFQTLINAGVVKDF